jgi:hypothetical protein
MNQNRKFTYLLGTHSFGVEIIIVFILWGVCIGVRAQEANEAQVVAGPDYKIVTQSVEKSGTLDGQPLYTLSYRFDFHNRDKIFLQEFGNIEAGGELSYLSPSKVVEFWSRDRKEKLATVEFQETAASRGGEAEEMPALKVFLPVKRKSPWPKNLPAQLILKVVNKHYPTGAHPWIEKDTQYFETLFEPLGSLPRGILGRVALLISFPTVPNSRNRTLKAGAVTRSARRRVASNSPAAKPER